MYIICFVFYFFKCIRLLNRDRVRIVFAIHFICVYDFFCVHFYLLLVSFFFYFFCGSQRCSTRLTNPIRFANNSSLSRSSRRYILAVVILQMPLMRQQLNSSAYNSLENPSRKPFKSQTNDQ